MLQLEPANVVLSLTAMLFCCVIGLFIIPTVLDRIIFYIPKLITLSREGSVYKKSVFITLSEVLGWTVAVGAVYTYFYLVYPDLFRVVTTSHMAILVWLVSAVNLASRYISFNKKIKKEFYYSAYMKYISPAALQAYLAFLEDIDNLYDEDLEALKKQKLPYMHIQAIDRKIAEKEYIKETEQKIAKSV